MYLAIESYLERLPAAMREVIRKDGSVSKQCIYTPHSLRATTASLLLAPGDLNPDSFHVELHESE